MKRLDSMAGLPIQVDPSTGRLGFGNDLPAVEPAVRRLAEMREVLENPSASGPDSLYYMYRDVGYPADRKLLHAHGLRYDITVIPPGLLGREYIKTAGHYHPLAPGADVTFPEVYEVLHGTALYLIQRANPPYADVEDAVVLEVQPGEKVIIPPGYGHVTINTGPGVLVMSNLVEKDFRSVYDPYKAHQGAAYYCIRAADGEPTFVENGKYGQLADLRMLPVMENPVAGLRDGVPLYRAAVADPSLFRYLVEPAKCMHLMELPVLDEGDEDDED